MEKAIEYSDFVGTLLKPGEDILKTLDSERFLLLISSLLLACTISDEVDLVKKMCIYNKDIDNSNLHGTIHLFNDFVKDEKIMDVINSIKLTPELMDLLHNVVGVFGEAGEIVHSIVKSIVNNEQIDEENLIEELGDISFYIQGILNNRKLTSEYVKSRNMEKLMVRYQQGYSDKAAQERADKAPGE